MVPQTKGPCGGHALTEALAFPNPTWQQVRSEIAQLHAELLANPSATATLQTWCDRQGLAPGVAISARKIAGEVGLGPLDRALLTTDPAEQIVHRRVELVLGARVLLWADNWYRPGRLTSAMNQQLLETQTPFGIVVHDLRYRRRTLSTDWSNATGPGVPEEIFHLRAVLETLDGQPFSLVAETYTNQVLSSSAR